MNFVIGFLAGILTVVISSTIYYMVIEHRQSKIIRMLLEEIEKDVTISRRKKINKKGIKS